MALDVCSHINEVDVVHEKLSPMYWREVVTMLGLHPKDLLDDSQAADKNVVDTNFTMDGWLNVLSQNGSRVKYPIVIFGQSAVLCQTPTDINKLKGKQAEKSLPHLKNYR